MPVRQKRSILVAAPRDAVWERLTHVAEWARWHPAFSAVEAATPIVPGARFAYTYRSTRIRAEVTTLAPMEAFAFIGRARGVTAHNRWTLIARSPASCEVTVEEEMRGLVPRLFPGPFNRELGNGLEDWLASLARGLETRPGDGEREPIP
jgi:hypothetical protein